MSQSSKLSVVKIVADLKRRRDLLERELEKVTSQLNALESVLREYSPDATQLATDLVSTEAKLSVRELLENFAYKNNGIVEVLQAKEYLVDLKRFDSKAEAGAAIGPILSNTKLFHRLGRGQYQSIKVSNDLARDAFNGVKAADPEDSEEL